MIQFNHILVPIDFGEPSRHAVQVGVELARQYGASLTLLHAWEMPVYAYAGMDLSPIDLLAPIESAAREQLDAVLADVKKEIPKATAMLKQGSAWREIIATIEQTHPDLVVIGTHGRRGVERAVLGSVAEKIVRLSPAPVLIVRAKAED
jgi:nucleotide-binding universal stress UspA family protein